MLERHRQFPQKLLVLVEITKYAILGTFFIAASLNNAKYNSRLLDIL